MVRWAIGLRDQEWRQRPTEVPGGPQTRDHAVALGRAAALGMEGNGGMEKHLGGREDGVCDRLGLGKPRRGRVLLPSNPWLGQRVDGGAIHGIRDTGGGAFCGKNLLT